MNDFLKNNSHLFVFLALLVAIAVLVVTILIHIKNSKLAKSMLVNKFRLVDLNEKNESENEPLYTVVIFNSSVNAVSLASIGFENDGDYYNFKDECRSQLESAGGELAILPRGSIKLRLEKSRLEHIIFSGARHRRLKPVRVYIIGRGGEFFLAKAPVITKRMRRAFKEYYPLHEQEINATFIANFELKQKKGIKVGLGEKSRYNRLTKNRPVSANAVPEVAAADEHTSALVGCEIEEPVVNAPEEKQHD